MMTDARFSELRQLFAGYFVSGTPRSDAINEVFGEIHRLRSELSTLRAAQTGPGQTIHVVFDDGPGPVAGRFVECETPDGKSINAGKWIKREDGYWALVIERAALPQTGPGLVVGSYHTIRSLPAGAVFRGRDGDERKIHYKKEDGSAALYGGGWWAADNAVKLVSLPAEAAKPAEVAAKAEQSGLSRDEVGEMIDNAIANHRASMETCDPLSIENVRKIADDVARELVLRHVSIEILDGDKVGVNIRTPAHNRNLKCASIIEAAIWDGDR